MTFKIQSDFKPTGDQPEAIKQLVEGINRGDKHQVLLGITGSGKTFTMANVIQEVQRPTLILTHNKTLVAQLFGEFTQFFPENAVEYFVSYYDYYQPEAYIPSRDVYIEKELAINDQIERLRLRTTTSLLSGRRDVIVVSSVSCIYGMGNPNSFRAAITGLKVGQVISRNQFLYKLVDILYNRTTAIFSRGTFRVNGDVVDIFPPYLETAFRISFWGDEIEKLEVINPDNGRKIQDRDNIVIFPANLFVTAPDIMQVAIKEIQDDLVKQLEVFREEGKYLEAKRLEDRVNFDLEMMAELGYCSGIENYSKYFDRRETGERPFCLLDYFPDDLLIFLDESHQSIPQIRGMFAGDRARKTNLVEYGFRLPAALDNRPLNFPEFETLINQIIYVSATPSPFELSKTEGVVVEQVIRPTGLLDPEIIIKPSANQIDDLMEEIDNRVKAEERVLVTTLTKRMAEELAKYFAKYEIRCRYIHSEIDTLERVEILRDLRLGVFDVLIGINLLREGLDLPEVSLVAILDADKEGFLRSETALTQIVGRAARNAKGKVIMYADKITESMRKTIDETNRRRKKQIEHNKVNQLTPTTVFKTREQIISQTSVAELIKKETGNKKEMETQAIVDLSIDPIISSLSIPALEKMLESTRVEMLKAAKDMDFILAASKRDEMYALQKFMDSKK